MMGELLYLDYQGTQEVRLVGIDYDPTVLSEAMALAKQQGLSSYISLSQQDAWCLGFNDEFDFVLSNELNIYEPDDGKVTALYEQFYRAYKQGGKLATSFLMDPPLPGQQL